MAAVRASGLGVGLACAPDAAHPVGRQAAEHGLRLGHRDALRPRVEGAADLARRWETQHVPMLVKPDDYLSVVEEVQAALRAGGIPTTRATATWMLRLPTKFLSLFARDAMATVAADNLTRLVAPEVEILLHPSDLVISGRDRAATRARAMLAERVTVTRASLTRANESNEGEDRIRARRALR